jgi:sulfur carrier protein
MKILLNGQSHEVAAQTTLAALLAQLNLESRHVAVEVNLEVVPRARHAECVLHEGDALEIVTLVGGG